MPNSVCRLGCPSRCAQRFACKGKLGFFIFCRPWRTIFKSYCEVVLHKMSFQMPSTLHPEIFGDSFLLKGPCVSAFLVAVASGKSSPRGRVGKIDAVDDSVKESWGLSVKASATQKKGWCREVGATADLRDSLDGDCRKTHLPDSGWCLLAAAHVGLRQMWKTGENVITMLQKRSQ